MIPLPRPRKYAIFNEDGSLNINKSNALRQRAYRRRQAALVDAQVKKKPGPQKQVQIEEEFFEPELIDTTQWKWNKWTLYFLGIQLLWYQVICLKLLDSWLRIILTIARRHGKTTFILRIFITRKICETRITNRDVNIAYVSSDIDNVQTVIFLVYNDLTENEKIIENYGFIPGKETLTAIESYKKKMKVKIRFREQRQTQLVLNSGYRKDVSNHTLYGITVAGKLRGKGFTHVFIDDPVDVFHTSTPDSKRKLTKKIYVMIQAKVIPLAIKNVSLIGTTYDTEGEDIFDMMGGELDGKVWKRVKYKAVSVFGEYEVRKDVKHISPSDIIIEHPEDWELLAPELWDLRAKELADIDIICTGLQLLVYLYHTMDRAYFMQEYQLESQALSKKLDYEWIEKIQYLPQGAITAGIFVDVSAGETQFSDYTGISLIVKQYQNYYIKDMVWGRWTPKEKVKQLKDFIAKALDEVLQLDNDIRQLAIMIETVMSQRDLFQRVRDETPITPIPITPAKRGEKEHRIIHGFGQEAENGNVFIIDACRNKTQLKSEMNNFPSKMNHLVDSIDQNIYYLKEEDEEMPDSGSTTSDFEKRFGTY